MNEDKAADLESVLRNLGFKKAEAVKRAEFVLSQHSDHVVALEQLIKEALAWTQPTVKQVIEAVQEVEEGVKAPEVLYTEPWTIVDKDASTPQPEPEPQSSSRSLFPLYMILILTGGIMYFGVVKMLIALAGLLAVVVLMILLLAAIGALFQKLGA
jgi:hypothetical protein